MSAAPAAKRARPPALDAAVSTLEVPGLGLPFGLLVLADGTRLVSTFQHTLQLLTPSGQLALIAGVDDAWEVCLLKFSMEMIQRSAGGNVAEWTRRGLV